MADHTRRTSANHAVLAMSIPLIQHRRADQLVAYRPGATVSAAQFVSDVRSLASQLPERRFVINLCSDRYRFAVGLCAALLRGQISLLPPNYTPAFVASLVEDHPGLYSLADRPLSGIDIERFDFPALEVAATMPFNVPQIPAEQVAAYVFTSGSTGRPTAHVKTWGGIARGAVAQAERFATWLRTPTTTLVGTVPPQHMYGLESSLILALQTGIAFFGGHPFYPADIRAALSQICRCARAGDHAVSSARAIERRRADAESCVPWSARQRRCRWTWRNWPKQNWMCRFMKSTAAPKPAKSLRGAPWSIRLGKPIAISAFTRAATRYLPSADRSKSKRSCLMLSMSSTTNISSCTAARPTLSTLPASVRHWRI